MNRLLGSVAFLLICPTDDNEKIQLDHGITAQKILYLMHVNAGRESLKTLLSKQTFRRKVGKFCLIGLST